MMKDGEQNGHLHGYGSDYNKKRPLDEEDVDEEEKDEPQTICCLQGCIAATVVGFSFLVALPTGILLVVYATNKKDDPLLSVGGVLVSLPLVMLIIVIFLCFNQRRLARLGRNRVTDSIRRKCQREGTNPDPKPNHDKSPHQTQPHAHHQYHHFAPQPKALTTTDTPLPTTTSTMTTPETGRTTLPRATAATVTSSHTPANGSAAMPTSTQDQPESDTTAAVLPSRERAVDAACATPRTLGDGSVENKERY